MTTFLAQVAQHILRQEGSDLRSIAIILPSIRAKKALLEALAQELGRALWAPHVLTMDALAFELSGLAQADSLEMQCMLYHIHTQLEESPLSPDEFMPLASKMLADFSDIDAYAIDPEKIFDHLHSVKSVEQWNPDGQEPSEWQKQYLHFYECLLDYYQALNHLLDQRKQAYFGKALRQMAQQLCEQEHRWPYQKTYFVGLNALTECEQQSISYLYERQQAEVLWDADDYYLNNPQHPAGLFLRKWRQQFSRSFQWIDRSFAQEKCIRVSALANDIGQAHRVAQCLNQWQPKTSQGQIAVVLGAESLLLPILNALPESQLQRVNITMGFSIIHTQIYALLETLFKMHARAESLSDAHPIKGRRYAYDDLFALNSNPLCPSRKISEKPFYLVTEIPQWMPEEETMEGLLKLIHKVLDRTKDHLPNDVERTAHAKINNSLDQAQEWLLSYDLPLSFRLFYKLFRQIFAPIRIAIHGDPSAPIQIMGLLETRAMDYASLIVCSLNEGVLPELSTSLSLIPSDVKYHYGLPMKREQDALLAYHFYRLLQRPSDIELLYTTQADPLSGSEKSRYIQQIELDLLGYNPSIQFQERAIAPQTECSNTDGPEPLKKDAQVMSDLWTFAQKRGFSATSIITFVNCPLKFYYKDVKRLRAVEVPSEDPDAMIMGNAIHQVLERVFRPLHGVTMNQEHYQQMQAQDLDMMLVQAFKKQLPNTDFNTGKPYLMRFIAEKMVRRFLNKEAQWVKSNELTIEATELSIQTTLEIHGQAVLCKGFIDRVDRSATCTRVLDYKTGALNPRELKVSMDTQFEISEKARQNDKSMQLLYYAWLLYCQPDRSDSHFQTGIISTRQVNAYVQCLNVDDNVLLDQTHMMMVQKRLKTLFERILDPNLDFVPCEDIEYCALCDYRMICGR